MAKVKSRDEEIVEIYPSGSTGRDFVGSIETELGVGKKLDNVLQILGNDTLMSQVFSHGSSTLFKHYLFRDAKSPTGPSVS